jgi:hypothetical protein
MKTNTPMQRWLSAALIGLALAGSAAVSQAQPYTNLSIARFDTASDPFDSFTYWWGLTSGTFSYAWDGTMNSTNLWGFPNTPGSGSMKITADWTGSSGNNPGGANQPQLMFFEALSGIAWNSSVTVNGFYYDLDFDLIFDPASAKTPNGDYGHIQAGVTYTDSGGNWDQVQLWDMPAFTNDTTTGWAHIHAYIDPTKTGVNQADGFYIFFPWQTQAGPDNSYNEGAIQGVQNFWIDNIIFNTDLTKNLKPPTLTLSPYHATPGLNISTAGAAEYDRNSIATVNPNYSWIGMGSTPVTYSLTIAQYPGTNYPYFQTHIFLASSPGTEPSPDWNEPNCIFVQIQNQPDGSGQARMMYKTNEPSGNTMLFSSNGPTNGTLGYITEPAGILGTWSLTFLNDTNATITTPSGLSTNFTFPDAAALQAAFPAGTVVVYFGGDPNATANIGQDIVLSQVKITGASPPITDNFTEATLDTNTWVLRAQEPADVTIVPNNITFALSWTLPDLDFYLQSAPAINGPWTDAGLTNTTILGTTKSVLVPKTALPAAAAGYFRMYKPIASQLQILLPGETAAPGTPTGKTGTPTAQPENTQVTLTVNAVDAKWNLVPYVTDTVDLTSTDGTANLPSDAALVNGTGSFILYFGQTGSFTVSATDVTDPAKTPATSASVTVTP